MSYLAKGAGRLAGSGRVAPAMASRSPLALADQRLNLAWFAAATPRRDRGTEAAEPADPLAAADTPRPAAAPRPAASPRPERPRPAATEARPAEAAPPAARPLPEAMPQRPVPAVPVDPPQAEATAPGSPPPHRAVARGLPRMLSAARRKAAAADDAPPVSPEASIRAEPANPAEPRETPATAPAPARPAAPSDERLPREAGKPQRVPDAVAALTEALAKAAAWTEKPPPATAVAEPARAAPHAGPARRREAAPPRLEIGRIEVEIVPPPAPQRAMRPARAARAPAMAPAPSQRTFGWRQR